MSPEAREETLAWGALIGFGLSAYPCIVLVAELARLACDANGVCSW